MDPPDWPDAQQLGKKIALGSLPSGVGYAETAILFTTHGMGRGASYLTSGGGATQQPLAGEYWKAAWIYPYFR
jgi:hypothetical protein